MFEDDEFANLPDDEFASLPDDDVIQPSENILQKAAKMASQAFGQGTQFDPNHPFQSGIKATMGGLKTTPGLGPYMIGQDIKSQAIEEANPGHPFQNAALDIVSDPSTWAGVEMAAKGAKSLGRSLFKPSKAYGEALGKAEGKVDFLKIISKHENDPVVKKVLQKAKVYEKYGGTSLGEGGSTTEKLANMSAKEAQNLINDVKLGKEALVQGKRIKTNELGLAEFFSDLSKAQSKLPGISGAKKLYGVSKNVGNFVKKNVDKFVTGGVIGAGAKTAYDVLK